jgi:DNA-directed RNA polymerase specialized sigma24 family protein
MKRFDAKALHRALDEQRKRRELSWEDISKEIGVSTSTLRSTKEGGRMEVDGMLAMVYWLNEKVETLVVDLPW